MCGDVFYFDYGVVVLWGLDPEGERAVVRGLVAPALVDPLDASEVEVDEFNFHYTLSEKPHIQNDTFTSEPRGRGVGGSRGRAAQGAVWPRGADAEGRGRVCAHPKP